MSRILAAHSQVEGTRELSELQRIVLEIGGKRSHPGEPVLPGAKETSYPGMLTELAPEDLRALGERYITDTRASRRHKPFFTDNMPNKFRHIGLIHLMLPKASASSTSAVLDTNRAASSSSTRQNVLSRLQAQSRFASDFPRRAFPVEELRALARPAQGQFGRALIRYHEEAESLSGVLRLSGCGPVAIKSGR